MTVRVIRAPYTQPMPTKSRNQAHRHAALERRVAALEAENQALAEALAKTTKSLSKSILRSAEANASGLTTLAKHYLNFLTTAGFVDKTEDLTEWLREPRKR